MENCDITQKNQFYFKIFTETITFFVETINSKMKDMPFEETSHLDDQTFSIQEVEDKTDLMQKFVLESDLVFHEEKLRFHSGPQMLNPKN